MMESRKNLKILQLNINGLKDKKDELEVFLNDNNFNAAILSETHGNPNEKVNIANFNIIKCHRIENNWGGVAILVKKNLNVRPLNFPQMEFLEVIGLYIKECEINLISIYLPPNKPINAVRKDISDLMVFTDGLQNVVMGGDFNAHNTYWGCRDDNNYGEFLLDKIVDSNLTLLNDGKYTRINRRNPENSSAIDLSLISPVLLSFAAWSVEEDNLGSDHQCIKVECRFNDNNDKMTKTVLNLDEAIKEINLLDFNRLDNIDNLIDSIKIKIKNNKKTIDNPFIAKPWWNEELKDIKNQKIEAIRDFNRHPTLERIIKVNELTAKLKLTIKKAKIKSWIEFLDTINPFTNIAEIWHAIRRIEGKKIKRKRINLIDDLNAGKQFMDNFYLDEDIRTPKQYRQHDENPLMTIKDLNEILSSKKETAPGEDGITYSLVRKMNDELKDKLVAFINEIWKSGNIPEKLKKINIIAILKPNKPEEIRNLRPISLLPVIIKIINTVIKRNLMFIVEKNKCLPRKSFGFRKCLSTTDAVTYLTNEIKAAKREGKYIAALFIDIKSAFDNVNVEVLFNILEKMKIPDQFCIWVYNFLINRKTSVKVGQQEIIYNVCKGLPQGDVLSPDLFNIYTRRIHDLNSDKVSVIQFADDVVICVKEKNKSELNSLLNSVANNFIQILNDLKLQISAEKTVIIPFFMKEHEEIHLRLGSVDIEKVDNHCWLGFEIDFQLRFGRFIRTIKHKLIKKIDILKKLTGTSWGGHPDTMSALYKGMIRNQLEYGCVVYNVISKTYENMIEVTVRKALRIVNGFTKSTPINAIHGISTEAPHVLRREFLSEKYVHKVVSNNNVIYQQLETNLRKEIEMLDNCDFMEVDKDKIIIHKNLDKMVCKKQMYSNCEFTFLTIWNERMKNTQKVMNTCYKNLSDRETKFPLVIAEIPGMNQKKSDYHPFELRNLSLEHLEKYDVTKLIFTDASKVGNECSIGIYAKDLNLSFGYKLTTSTSIMLAELHGIHESLRLAYLSRIAEPVILTDSINSCFIINKSKFAYKLYPVVKHIIMLAKHLKAVIQWIPSHINIDGNEKADEMAKKVLTENLLVENICNKLTDKDFINESKHKFFENFQTWYSTLSIQKGKLTYSIMPVVEDTPWYKKSSLPTEIIKMINRILSNHAYTPKFLKLIKVSDTDICINCNVTEDVEHIIFNCPKYSDARIKLNMSDCNNILQLKQKFKTDFINKLANFIKDTKIKI